MKTLATLILVCIISITAWAQNNNLPDAPPGLLPNAKGEILPTQMKTFGNCQPPTPPGFKFIMSPNDPRYLSAKGDFISVAYFNGPSFGGAGGKQGLVGFVSIDLNKKELTVDGVGKIMQEDYAPKNINQLIFNRFTQAEYETWAKNKLEERIAVIKSMAEIFPEPSQDKILLPRKWKVQVANPNGFQPYVGNLLPFGSRVALTGNTTQLQKIAEDGDRYLIKVVYQEYFGDWTVAGDFPTMINLLFFMPKETFDNWRNLNLAFMNIVSVDLYKAQKALEKIGQQTVADKEKVKQLLQKK